MRKQLAYIVTTGVLLAVSQASAQSEFTPFTAESYALWESCSDSVNAGPPAAAVATCLADIASIEALQARNPNALLWEKDFTWMMSAGAHLSLSGAYGDIDGVLSARVCDETERWWLQLGYITPGSDFDQSGNVEDEALVRRCRNERGAPNWGRPLP